MKKLTIISIIFWTFMGLQSVSAQQMAALHQSGQTTYFTGVEAFQGAYAAAANGATIYLSGGSFLAPDSIAKTLTVFGAGHHPEFSGATGQTAISGNMNIATGSDDSHFEGIHFLNALEFGRNRQIDNLVFRRCRIDGRINSNTSTGNQNFVRNMLITECVLASTAANILYSFRDLTITNSIIAGSFNYGSFLLFSNNIFLNIGITHFWSLKNSTVQNCIIASNLSQISGSTENRYLNNVLFNVQSSFSWGGATNVRSNNYYSISRDNFFVDQEGNTFNYTHDYHLQSPGQYIGSDGTQVGIYGGMHPFKEGSVPMIPHVISKSISHSIDAEGKLQVEIEVSAQDH